MLTKTYWREAASELKNIKILAFAALMIAACAALGFIPSIPIGDAAKVSWGFLARAVCGMVCGPVVARVFGFAEDTWSYLVHPTGAYFPGYAITTMLGTMIYALFLYKRKITLPKIFLAKLCTNVLNVVLGTLWTAIVTDKGYLFYLPVRAIKNLVMLPVQTIMLALLIGALAPILKRVDLSNPLLGRRARPGT